MSLLEAAFVEVYGFFTAGWHSIFEPCANENFSFYKGFIILNLAIVEYLLK